MPEGRIHARKITAFMQKAGWLFCCSLLVGHLQGATFVVGSPWDFDPALPGTLRQAILDANSALGSDTIQISAVGTIVLVTDLPAITDNTTIIGPGTNLLTVSGNNQVQVFSMNPGTTNTLFGLTIADGKTMPFAYGEGISNAGCLNLLNCAILYCGATGTGGGAGIYNAGKLEMQACVIDGCGPSRASGLDGGGLFNTGTARMSDCTVAHCSADRGGGIYNQGGSLFLTNCVIDSCANDYNEGDGPAIYNWNGDVVLHTSIITNCMAGWWGALTSFGGSLAATNTTIVGNYWASEGGGMFLEGGSNLFVGCTISGNSGGAAGGILNNSILTLLNCTISQNHSYMGMGTLGNGVAGGILNGTNRYFSGATIHLNSCTVVSNTAAGYYSTSKGGIENDGGTVYSENSIFAGNVSNDFSGVFTSQGYNLIQNTIGCTIVGDQTGSIYGADPLLGPLQHNGGPTWTHALLPGSPALDQGTPGGLTTDQRGVTRTYDVPDIANAPGGDGSDIGAYEWTPPHSAFRITPGGSPTAGSPYALTITAVDQYQNTVTTVTGHHSFTFAGLAVADDGTYPTITDKNGNAVNLGTATTITFTNGVSSAGGSLLAYKAGTATLTGSDATSGKTTSDTGGTGASLTIANVNPVAGADTETRQPNMNLKILKSKLVGIAADANHDVLDVSGVEATSTGGATLSNNATYVFYLPNSAGDGDTFTYTVSDGNGGTATGVVTVRVATRPSGPYGEIGVCGCVATVKMFGIPGVQYDIQRSTNMNTWTTLLTAPPLNTNPPIMPAADGSISFTDNFSDLGGQPASAYYRIMAH